METEQEKLDRERKMTLAELVQQKIREGENRRKKGRK